MNVRVVKIHGVLVPCSIADQTFRASACEVPSCSVAFPHIVKVLLSEKETEVPGCLQ
jgi:hypothetical protein